MSSSISSSILDEDVVDKIVSKGFEEAAGNSPPPPSHDVDGVSYVSDLIYSSVPKVLKWSGLPGDKEIRIRRTVWTIDAYFKFLLGGFDNLIRTIVMDPSAVIFNPVRSLMALVRFLLLQVVGLIFALVTGLAHLLGITSFLRKWGQEHGIGSIWNMGDPNLFTSYDNIVKNATKIFESGSDCPSTTVDVGAQEGERVRYFNLDVSKTLLLFCAAMYERDEYINDQAIVLSIQNKPLEAKAVRYVAEGPIRKIAARWGLRFKGINDLNSYGGSYAGIWWQEDANWVVISFKGTSPWQGAEWLKDLTVHKTNGKAYLFGSLHTGWYTTLFANYQKNVGYSPYGNMVNTIAKIASTQKGTPLNVYVTGHSLGSALAQAFYTRIVKSPLDMGPNVQVKNGYMYGSPRIGNVEWAAGYYGIMNVPFGNSQILYRVINSSDLVCDFPSGLGDDPRERDYLKPNSFLNYTHVGEAVKVTGKDTADIAGNSFIAGVTIRVVQDTTNPSSLNGVTNSSVHAGNSPPKSLPVEPKTILSFLPASLLNHLPPQYMLNLNKLVPTYNANTRPNPKSYVVDNGGAASLIRTLRHYE